MSAKVRMIGRLMSDLALALARLRIKINSLSPIDFAEIAECEKQIEKLKSKVDSLYDNLIIQTDETVVERVLFEFNVLAASIEEYFRVLNAEIEQKGWLYNKWKKFEAFLGLFEPVTLHSLKNLEGNSIIGQTGVNVNGQTEQFQNANLDSRERWEIADGLTR